MKVRVMPLPRGVVVGLLTVSLAAAACGDDDGGGASSADRDVRTIEVEMRDIAFAPTAIEVEAGETVRFVFPNTGVVTHEAVLGTADEQGDHADEMDSMGSMDDMDGMDHGGEDAVTVQPGDTGELTHTFGDAGSVQLGCHQPGHFEAGMVLDITVT